MKIKVRLTPTWWDGPEGTWARWGEAQRLALKVWPDAVLKVTATSLHAVIEVPGWMTAESFTAGRDIVREQIAAQVPA